MAPPRTRDHGGGRRPEQAGAPRAGPRRARHHPDRRRARCAGEDLPMTMLVLGENDVRTTLEMGRCIEAMESVLAALARGDVSMPLRSIVPVPDESILGFGLMPA